MTRTFDIAALRCACGSLDVIAINPGADAEMDPVFASIMLKRSVPARGWCIDCWALLPPLPAEKPKNKRRPAK